MPATRKTPPPIRDAAGERAPSLHAKPVRNMLDRHIKNSVWLKSRAPLILAMSDLALEPGSTDSVRIRALEKIEEMLEKAEDEKRRETFEGLDESIEASIRRLEGAIRRSRGNS